MGSELNMENAVPGFYVNNLREMHNIPVELITSDLNTRMDHKVDSILRISSYESFLRAANLYILTHNLHNAIFIDDHCNGFEEYRDKMISEDFGSLLAQAGCSEEQLATFVENFNNEHQSVIIYSEMHLSSEACHQMHNLSYLTGKSGKNASGLISLKEKNNAQGLFDMGACAAIAPGGKNMHNEKVRNHLESEWKVSDLPANIDQNQWELLLKGAIKNAFIFGEDPLGCAIDKKKVKEALEKTDFLIVQDLFMSETAAMANLVLPAAAHFETGGSYSNTQKFIQQFEASKPNSTEVAGINQILGIAKALGFDWSYEDPADVLLEAAGIIQRLPESGFTPYRFVSTSQKHEPRRFKHGCDYLVKYFDDEWQKAFNPKEE